MKNNCFFYITLVMLSVFSNICLSFAQVNIYGSAQYDNGQLSIDLYADITDSSLLSFGISVNYDPSSYSVVSAEKNESIWYFGNSTTKYAYKDPDTTTLGKVLILGGKLDSGDPSQGVSGTKVLLGKVVFDCDQSALSNLPTIGYARADQFKNFVTTKGEVLDNSSQLTFSHVSVISENTSQGSSTSGGDSGSSGICFINICLP